MADYTPRHSEGPGRVRFQVPQVPAVRSHRNEGGRHRDPSDRRRASLGGYTPSHGKAEKSTRKRAAAQIREVKARNKGDRSIGSLFRAVWDLGYR